MTDASSLLTWFGTLLYFDEAGRMLRHGPLATSPRNVVLRDGATRLEILRPERDAGHAPAGQDRNQRDAHRPDSVQPGGVESGNLESGNVEWGGVGSGPNDLAMIAGHGQRGVGVRLAEGYLRILPDGETDGAAATIDTWEQMLPLRAHQLDLVLALLGSGWFVPRGAGVIPRWSVELQPGFRLRAGAIELDLAGPAFPLVAQTTGTAGGRIVLRTLDVLYDDWKIERLERFSPLIYFTIFRDAFFLESMQLTVESLERVGRYTGDYLLISDAPEAQCRRYFPDISPERVHYSHDPAPALADIAAARRLFDPAIVGRFQPVLYLDADIIADAPVEPMLRDIMHSDEIFFSTEFVGASLHEANAGATNWFGRFLADQDLNWDPRLTRCINSGMIAARHADLMTAPFATVSASWHAWRERNGTAHQTYLDQPFINYVLQKTRAANVTTLDHYARCVHGGSPAPSDARRGFVHFNSGVGHNKYDRMRAYLEALLTEQSKR